MMIILSRRPSTCVHPAKKLEKVSALVDLLFLSI